jgi:ParB family transcriptional regulator, chromosome partitioning protein
MAKTQTYVPKKLYTIALAELLPDPNQPRKYFDPAAMEELTASIAQNGVMSPIFFRMEKGLKYIVAGERRCIAAKKAGLTTIPAIYIETPNHREISLIENMVRSDLNPVEEAEALDRLLQESKYQQNDLARIVSKSKAYISETLTLMKLPTEIRDECRNDPAVPKKTLLAIAKKTTPQSMQKAYQQAKDRLKPKAGTGVRVTRVQSAVKAMDATQKKIQALKIETLTSEARESFFLALENLKQAIETLVAANVK